MLITDDGVSTGVSTFSLKHGFINTYLIVEHSDMNAENPRNINKKRESLYVTGFPVLCGRRDLNPYAIAGTRSLV